MQPDCNGNGVRSSHIPWYGATEGDTYLGNDLNDDFLK